MEDRELAIEIPLLGSIKSDSGNAFVDFISVCGVIIVVLIFKKIMQRKDRWGRDINDPFFRREDIDFAHGGLAEILRI